MNQASFNTRRIAADRPSAQSWLIRCVAVLVLWLGMVAPGWAQQGQNPPQQMQGGVDLAGLDFGTAMPGRLNYDYVQPTQAELTYYHGKGLNLVRLPVRWERLQPNLFAAKPNTAFDPAYLALVQQVIGWAGQLGMTVIVDVHNYGGYGTHKLGDGTLTAGMFGSFWRHLASTLAARPGLGGYDLMNEPNGMPKPSVWPMAAQSAVNAIREVDSATTVYVEGYFYASAVDWMTYNATLSINDWAHRLIYQAHVYGDRDNSGTHMDWTTEASFGVTVNTIAQRVSVFTGWCQARGVKCMIGETGVPNTGGGWLAELQNGLAAMQAGGIVGFTYWAGGPWWGSFPLSIEPTAGRDAVQMPLLDIYATNAAHQMFGHAEW